MNLCSWSVARISVFSELSDGVNFRVCRQKVFTSEFVNLDFVHLIEISYSTVLGIKARIIQVLVIVAKFYN